MRVKRNGINPIIKKKIGIIKMIIKTFQPFLFRRVSKVFLSDFS